MESRNIYQDIAKRTDGDIYIGVVGPVRTGKSTFIKKFMETLVIPNIDSDFRKERATDELPQSCGGQDHHDHRAEVHPGRGGADHRWIETPQLNVRLIDCVGYIVPSSLGYIENEMPRMVMTPWFDERNPL